MEQVSIVKFHQLDKSILNSVVRKLHISRKYFNYRVNLVDLPISSFPKPLLVVCHQCGVFDLFVPISYYNYEIITSFDKLTSEMFDYYLSKEKDIWECYYSNKSLDEYVRDYRRVGDGYRYTISKERITDIWAKRCLKTIFCAESHPEHYQFLKALIQYVCHYIHADDERLLFDIIVDTNYYGEQYLTKTIHRVLKIGKGKFSKVFKCSWDFTTGIEAKLRINNHDYYIHLLYKRFGSFEPVTVSFRKHYQKTNLYFESYYTHRNVDELVERVKKVEEAILQWNSLIMEHDLRGFVEQHRDDEFFAEPAVMCQMLARKYMDTNKLNDDEFGSRYLSLCILVNDELQKIYKEK